MTFEVAIDELHEVSATEEVDAILAISKQSQKFLIVGRLGCDSPSFSLPSSLLSDSSSSSGCADSETGTSFKISDLQSATVYVDGTKLSLNRGSNAVAVMYFGLFRFFEFKVETRSSYIVPTPDTFVELLLLVSDPISLRKQVGTATAGIAYDTDKSFLQISLVSKASCSRIITTLDSSNHCSALGSVIPPLRFSSSCSAA